MSRPLLNLQDRTYRDCPMCDGRRSARGRLTESGKCYMFRCVKCEHRFAGAAGAPEPKLVWDVLDFEDGAPPPRNMGELVDYIDNTGAGLHVTRPEIPGKDPGTKQRGNSDEEV